MREPSRLRTLFIVAAGAVVGLILFSGLLNLGSSSAGTT
jgi:hypothetical protein